MYTLRSLFCYNCNSIILTLPENEISKLDGLSFECNCCGHQNLLDKLKFFKGSNDDPYRNIISAENIV